MARHAAPKTPRHALLRAGLTVTAAGAVVGLGAAAAQAAPVPDTSQASQATSQALLGAVGHVAAGGLTPVKDLRIDPLANTGVDPLDNGVGTQVADFKPISTGLVTGPVTHGGALGTLPVTGQLTSLLPG